MFEEVVVKPVGVVQSEVHEPVDDVWGNVRCRIQLDASRFQPDSLAGLEGFSHIEVIFVLHRLKEEDIVYGARHPRGREDLPLTGIFAQRGRNRPNRLGVTVCRLLGVRELTIEVEGLDAIDGTPVLDIKPYLREFGPRGDTRQPLWAGDLMSSYWGKAR